MEHKRKAENTPPAEEKEAKKSKKYVPFKGIEKETLEGEGIIIVDSGFCYWTWGIFETTDYRAMLTLLQLDHWNTLPDDVKDTLFFHITKKVIRQPPPFLSLRCSCNVNLIQTKPCPNTTYITFTGEKFISPKYPK